jgi:hypothetical protein
MVQMLSRTLKPLGRPKQPRPTSKLNNTTIRDFGGGLNVVDSEQNLTSKFSPVFDNMVTYTDRRVGPRYGYEMWLKLKTGAISTGTASISITTNVTSNTERIVVVNWTAHPFTGTNFEHLTISDWNTTFAGIVPEMMNRTHGIRRVINANSFEIVLSNRATSAGTSPSDTITWTRDNYLLGGEPIECRYFANYVILWTSVGEILRIDRDKNIQRIWSQATTAARPLAPIAWTHTEMVAQDIFGSALICSNGRDKPLRIDFQQTDWVAPLLDGVNGDINVPAFDACKAAFRYFTVHDTELLPIEERLTSIRISAKDTSMVFSSATDPGDAVDINMSKIVASPEQTVRGFATIKDTILVITPTATTMMKYGIETPVGDTGVAHDPQPVDTLNGFGSNAPRSIVEIGSDVFMVDFNGVPSAKLSSVSNAVQAERVSNYIETMMSKHIGRLRKETMRLKTFGFYDAKNKTVHFYLPKYDSADIRALTRDPFYFDTDMASNEFTKRTLIMRIDDHQLEIGDNLIVAGASSFGTINAADINGNRQVVGVLNENYVLMSIGVDLPITGADSGGGGINTTIQPINDSTTGYIYHYVPQLKLFAWSRFKTPVGMRFNCGCGTVEGRAFLFTPDGFMMRYGSPDRKVHGDWFGMYDFATWTSGQAYVAGQRVFDNTDGLVYKCIADVTTTAPDFPTARIAAPDSWEEYKGDPINFEWELPWSDFGARQNTKSLRFCHIDANGEAPFTLSLFDDNIYKNAATGQLTPARSLQFVPNESGAYGAGAQVYGAGRRTREQKLWQVPVRFKILKPRISGASTQSLSISGMSFLYQRGLQVRG